MTTAEKIELIRNILAGVLVIAIIAAFIMGFKYLVWLIVGAILLAVAALIGKFIRPLLGGR